MDAHDPGALLDVGHLCADRGAELLTRARGQGALSDEEIGALASLINNSLVGASKLLHFVAPEHFAIWDLRIYRFLYEREPHPYRVKSMSSATASTWKP